MKNSIRNTFIVLTSALVLNAAQAADGNGGLMTELMAKKYQVQPITDAAAQARLAQVQIRGESHENGGLMSELMAYRTPTKVMNDEQAQERLAQVKIRATEGNGGLMTEMTQL